MGIWKAVDLGRLCPQILLLCCRVLGSYRLKKRIMVGFKEGTWALELDWPGACVLCVITDRSYNISVFSCLGSMNPIQTSRTKHVSGQYACHCCDALQSSRLCRVLYLYDNILLPFDCDSAARSFAL